ncbi:MAG: toprim domain-containing protein [Oscillospiraceae bacterium]
MEKLKISQAVIVEGKYDKIKLSSFLDAIILTTNGFGIYKDEDLKTMVRYYADSCGIIILTDSDTAGFRIRGYIKRIVPEGKIINIYAPEIFGKEKRKTEPSKEGKLGVEGINVSVLKSLFEKAGVIGEISAKSEGEKITMPDFYELGLYGKSDSTKRREILLKAMNMPLLVSPKAMLEIVNTMFSKDEFLKFAENHIN